MPKRKRIKGLLAFLLAISLVWVALDVRMRPLVREYAVNRAKALASQAMAAAVDMVLLEQAYDYDRLITIQRSDKDEVLSVQTNASVINRFGAEVVAALGELLLQDDYTRLTVPLFSATGSVFLSGRGPRIPIHIQQNGAATTNMHSSFAAAGINQTVHRLELTWSFRMVVLVAGMSEPIETTGTFLIAETVIVGTVPDRYVGIEGMGKDGF